MLNTLPFPNDREGITAANSLTSIACRTLHYFFFSITRQPPQSTLFPYTTLFRSVLKGILFIHKQSLLLHRLVDQLYGQDRKSTRLNSSHVSISYAVFCLKKKKK